MKAIVKKGTPLFDELTKLTDRIKECRNAARKLTKDLGFTSHFYSDRNLGGGIVGFASANGVPEGYRKDGWGNIFPKKNLKANKEVLDKIAALPIVTGKDLRDILKYQTEYVGNCRSSRPGLIWREDYCLLDFIDGTQYKPIKGMKEITASQYHELAKQKEEVES